MNLAPAIAVFRQSDITLLVQPGSWVKGRYVEDPAGVSKRIVFKGLVQPFPEKRLKHFPSGQEAFGAKLNHTTRVLQTIDEDSDGQTEADRVEIDCTRFKIAATADWMKLGKFNRYIAVLDAAS